MSTNVFDDRICTLGEGLLWHPERNQLFWFDIIEQKMLSRAGDETLEWQFDECFSAAGWINYDQLLLASESGLHKFDIDSGELKRIVELEAHNPITRSNDGRADPWGGFWIGTMGKNLEPRAGAIYRFYKGKLHKLYPDMTIPNAICFSPDKQFAYYTDTPTQQIMRQALDEDGWPDGQAECLIDLRSETLNPDGAVTDKDGNIWNAQWGASRVACYAPSGIFKDSVTVPASQASCPAFGGNMLSSLFVTSATQNPKEPTYEDGKTFCIATQYVGLAEYQVQVV